MSVFAGQRVQFSMIAANAEIASTTGAAASRTFSFSMSATAASKSSDVVVIAAAAAAGSAVRSPVATVMPSATARGGGLEPPCRRP